MSSIKRAFTRVVNGSHSRSPSKSSSTSNGDAHSLPNGNGEKHSNHPTFDETNSPKITAAQQQQQADELEHRKLKRPDSLAISKKLSFTELKEERRVEREAKEEQEARERKERMKKAHDEVCRSPRK